MHVCAIIHVRNGASREGPFDVVMRGTHIITKRYRLLALAAACAAGLFVMAAAFAGVDERTIHIFPTLSTNHNWDGTNAALEQTLSGSAIFDDFNPENSAFLLQNSEWYSSDDATTSTDVLEDSVATTTLESTASSTDAVLSYYAQPVPDITPGAYLRDVARSVFTPAARAQEGEVQSSDSVSSQESVDEPPTEAAPAEQSTAHREEVVEVASTESIADDGIEEGADELAVPADSPAETPEQTDAGDEVTVPVGEEDAVSGEQETAEAGQPDTTDTPADEPAASVEPETSEATSRGDGDASATSSDVVEQEEVVATTTDERLDTEQTQSGGSGGGGSWGEDDVDAAEPVDTDSSTDTQTASVISVPPIEDAEDVAICTILGDPCYLMSVTGFGLGWDLGQFDAKGFDLKVSMGARVDAAVGDEDKLYVRYFDGREWHIAAALSLRGELSNYTNGGHFTFPMPEITSWRKLDDLEVQIEYVPGGSRRAELYVDAVWVDARYDAPDDETLPELPQLYDELQALEASAQPDVLVTDDEGRIGFEHTDENKEETLIIKSDKKIYEGLTRATVYFNVTNESERQDQFHLQVYFPESRGEVATLKQYTKNIPVVVEEPVYQPMAQTCAAGWRYDEELNRDVDNIISEGTPGPVETGGGEEDVPLLVLGTSTEAVLEQEHVDVVEEVNETSAAQSTTSAVFVDDIVAVDTPATTSIDVVQRATTSAESVSTSTDTAELPPISEEVLEARLEELFADEEEALAGFYQCFDDDTVLFCDALNADGTNCIQNRVQIDSIERTEYTDDFLEVGIVDGEQVVEHSLFTKAAQLFGLTPEQKDVPADFVVKDSTAELHTIEAGQTLYFEMEISYPAKSRGEFWIEAIGKKGAYGLLDPWWNSGWIYRMPVTVDNTSGAFMTEQQVYLELDSTLTDFWSHVQEDGDDIRFLRQVDGYAEWLDTSFPYRLPVTVASSTIDAGLNNFPVYVNLADLGNDFWNNVKDDGGDIRISAGDSTTELAREIVSIATTTKQGELYFQANSLSSSTDNVFYIYYGSSTASDYADTDTYGAHNVWDDDYVLVTHLDDLTTTSVENSKSNSYDGSKGGVGDPTETTTGKIGEAQEFAPGGVDDISHGNFGTPGQFTAEAWVYADATTGSGDYNTYGFTIMASANSGDGYPLWLTLSGSEVRFWAYESTPGAGGYRTTSGAGIGTSGWHHIAATAIDGGESKVYVDGVERLSFTNDGERDWTSIFTIGDLRPTRDINFDGEIDEVRISTTTRSADWIGTTFKNQATTSDFYATSSMQTYVQPVMEELDFWTQQFSSTTETAHIWLQVDELEAAASTTLYMYYGNAGAGSASDEYDPFTYSTSTELYYTLRNDYSSNEFLEVYSYIDNNVVRFSNDTATTSLNFGQSTSTTNFTATTTVWATGPLMAKIQSTGENWDSMVPIGFASTEFAVGPRDGNTEVWHIGSPFGYASTTIFGASTVTVNTVTSGASTQTQAVNSATAAVVESDIPVLLAFEGASNDGLTVYPATTEDLYGVVSNGQSSNGPYVGITTNGTTMDVSCSASASTTSGSQNRFTRYEPTACASGAQGAGEAVRLYNISDPVGASQNADGDGGDASFHWAFRELATEYMLPVTTSYVAIACAPNTGTVNIGMYNAADELQTSASCVPGTDNPGKAYFGDGSSNNYTAGYYLKSTDSPAKPFYAVLCLL